MNEKFLYDNRYYNLPEVIILNAIRSGHYEDIYLKELQMYLQAYPQAPFEEMLKHLFAITSDIGKNRLPIEISKFSDLAKTSKSDTDIFKLLGTDISNNKSKIDLNLYSMFYCGKSNICIFLPYINAINGRGYIPLLNRVKRSRHYNLGSSEQKEEAGRVVEFVSRQFNDCPIFAGINPKCDYKYKVIVDGKSIEGDIDVAIYTPKDKTLILIEVKSTYGIIFFKDRARLEKCLYYAGYQLSKTVTALADPKLLAEVTGDSNVKFDDLRIETMIASTSFEFDGQRFQGHRKVSLLELMVLLHNDATNLIWNSPKFACMTQYLDKSNPSPKDRRQMENIINKVRKDLNLYNTKNPSVNDFLNALNFNLWEKVLPYWQKKLE
jgi:hypothetical protein